MARIIEPLTVCCVCGEKSRARFKGKEYCKRHLMQMWRYGKILERTIFDRNEWIMHDDYAECITYDKSFNVNGHVKFDLDDYEKLKDKKIYVCNHNGKIYAIISAPQLRKILAHRFVMGVYNEEYSIRRVVDHINGDTLDNRKNNLRICSQGQNMANIRKKGKVTGVNERDGLFIARIMKDYKSIEIGKYDTYEEAVLARITKERELSGDFGPNRDLFYVLETSSPIEELKIKLKEIHNDTD